MADLIRSRSGIERWHRFWRDRRDAGHRRPGADRLRRCADELLLHAPAGPLRILDLGCGNGDLYPHLRRRCADYLGVDFSPAMLDGFRRRWPGVALHEGDVTELPRIDTRFDIILANEVCQYLGTDDLHRMLLGARRLLHPGGVVLLANVPDAHLRLHYYAGALRGDRALLRGLVRRYLSYRVLGRDDGIGVWHTRHALLDGARRAGFAGETVSSANLEYRFHARLCPVRAAITCEAKPLREPDATDFDLRRPDASELQPISAAIANETASVA